MMRKITEIQAGQFSAKVYRDAEWNEYRVKFFHAGSYLPDGDYFTDEEEDARNTATMCLQHMADGAQRDAADAADATSETEELNIRLSREFNWTDERARPLDEEDEKEIRRTLQDWDNEAEEARADMIYENVRAYLIRRRAVYKDATGGIVSIIERDYPQDMAARDCRDDLLTFAPLDWMSVEVEAVPIIGRPSNRYFSYTPDGDVL